MFFFKGLPHFSREKYRIALQNLTQHAQLSVAASDLTIFGILSVGPHRIGTKLYPNFFFPKEMDHGWGGVGWGPRTKIWMNLDENFFQNDRRVGCHPIGAINSPWDFSAGDSDGTESAGGSSPMATRQVGRF